jgi:hypothetical protein
MNNTGSPITVTVTSVTTSGTNGGPPPGSPPTGPAKNDTLTIPNGSSTTSASFTVGNIGGGDAIEVTVSVTVGGSTYTLTEQVH